MQLPPPDVAPIAWSLRIENRLEDEIVLRVDGWSSGFENLIEQLRALPASVTEDFGPGERGFPNA